MKNLIKLSFLVLIVTLSACSANHIDYDKQVDFKQYKTFAYYKKGIDALKIPADKKKFVLKTVTSVLKQKGFSKSARPDFIVNVFTSLSDRVDVYPGYYAPWGVKTYAQTSKEGTLYIDIVDIKAKRVVWSGSRYIDLHGNDYRTFRKAITKLLNDFPPNK
jgi:hypothetical protein